MPRTSPWLFMNHDIERLLFEQTVPESKGKSVNEHHKYIQSIKIDRDGLIVLIYVLEPGKIDSDRRHDHISLRKPAACGG
jgi:hypothetical protein